MVFSTQNLIYILHLPNLFQDWGFHSAISPFPFALIQTCSFRSLELQLLFTPISWMGDFFEIFHLDFLKWGLQWIDSGTCFLPSHLSSIHAPDLCPYHPLCTKTQSVVAPENKARLKPKMIKTLAYLSLQILRQDDFFNF